MRLTTNQTNSSIVHRAVLVCVFFAFVLFHDNDMASVHLILAAYQYPTILLFLKSPTLPEQFDFATEERLSAPPLNMAYLWDQNRDQSLKLRGIDL